jgi:hypothetical protein
MTWCARVTSSIPNADEIRLRHMLDAGQEAVRSARVRGRSDLDHDPLIHAYFDLDLDQVWNAVTEDLPALLADLQNILEPRP